MTSTTRLFATTRPLWMLALASFFACECIICWLQDIRYQHHWFSLSFIYVPAIATLPLTVGVHLYSRIAVDLAAKSEEQLTNALATMVIASYVTLICSSFGVI